MASAPSSQEAEAMTSKATAAKAAPPVRSRLFAADPGRRLDEMCEGSFPASDPPAVWTWEVAPRADLPSGEPADGDPGKSPGH